MPNLPDDNPPAFDPDALYSSGRDWAPEYVHKCGVCNSTDDVIPVTEWNRGLCRKCLPKALEHRIFLDMRRREMLHVRDRVGVCVSGGKDSAALLACLANLRRRRPFSVLAIYIDMGIPGYSAACRDAVTELCRRYAVRLIVEEAAAHDVAPMETGHWNVCAACGGIRRALFPRIARRENLDVIATGHTLEDMLQIMLKQILSGRTFAPKAVLPAGEYDPKKIKPLYFIPERLTAAYAQIEGLEFEPSKCPYFPPDTHRFKDVFAHLERLAPMSKIQFLTNLGHMMKSQPVAERPYECLDCGERAQKSLCPLCTMRRLQHDEPLPTTDPLPSDDPS